MLFFRGGYKHKKIIKFIFSLLTLPGLRNTVVNRTLYMNCSLCNAMPSVLIHESLFIQLFFVRGVYQIQLNNNFMIEYKIHVQG